ncbi:hypothetical protein, partial [Pseudomonas savastanoi]|uniref:hypothetical protein n=1 Tax=Pseudomonas savastanoi TaxID=29438 RepID=UPI003F739251
PPISKRRAEICPRNAKQGRQVEKNRLGNEDGANGLIVQRLPKGIQNLLYSQHYLHRTLQIKNLYL